MNDRVRGKTPLRPRDWLVDALLDRTPLTRRDVRHVLRALPTVVGECLADGHGVQIPGIATLRPTVKAAQRGRNPRTGDPIQIPARRGVKVRVMPSLLGRKRG